MPIENIELKIISFLFLFPVNLYSIEITDKKNCLDFLDTNFFSSKDYSHVRLVNFLSQTPRYIETNQGFSFGPINSLPLQGWKLHISFPQHHAFDVIEKIIPFLIKEFPTTAFKIPDTPSFERGFGNKDNSQYGKLITIYPENAHEFHKICEALKPQLQKIEQELGPFIEPKAKGDIPTQIPGLFARYGRFTPSLSISDNEIIRVNRDGNALNKKNEIIEFKNKPINLIELNQHLRPLSKEEKEQTNEIFNYLRDEGAIEKDDRNQTPIWAIEFIEKFNKNP
jgi:hypothetical protein